MSQTAKRLIEGAQLSPEVGAYYTAPDRTRTVIQSLTLTNTSELPQTANVYLVPAGWPAGVRFSVGDGRPIPKGESRVVTGAINQVIEAGGSIQADASGDAAITIVASGVEIVG